MNKAAKTVPRDPATEPVEIHSGNGLGVLSSSEAEDHLLTISRLFWEKRRLLQRAALVGSLIALIVGLLTPNIYHSTSRLMPPDNQSGSGLAALLASRAGNELGFQPGGLPGDLLGVKTRGAVFVEILRSRTAKEDIVDQFDLTSAYGRPWLHQRVALDDADKELGQNTEISEDAKSGVITISVANRDPHLAAKLTQGYVDQLNKLLSGLSTSAAGRERQFLEQRLVEVKKELEDATHQLSEFSSTNSTLDPKEQGRAMVEAAASLQGELIAAESQLKGLEEIYAASNVRIRSLQARIAELQRQVRHVSGLTSSASPAEVGDANMPFPSIRQLPYLGATYADLYRRVKIQETVYELLTQQYEMAKVQEAKEIPTVRVLDQADVPRKRWGPHRVLLTLLGAMVGLLLGGVWVISTDRWERCDLNSPYKTLVSEILATSRQHWVWKRSARAFEAVHVLSNRGEKASSLDEREH